MNQNNCLSKPVLPFSAILLDMDGVLFHGMNPIDGAIDFMQSIEHIPHVFVTNNPIRSPESMANKTSGEATAAWLAQQKPEFHFFAIGAGGLHQSLQK